MPKPEPPKTAVKHLPDLQYINQLEFMVEYEVSKIGPSGIGSVELYRTRDDGKTWEPYAYEDKVGNVTKGTRLQRMVQLLEGEPDGIYGFTATETDAASLTSAHSNVLTVDVDPSAPTITTLVGTPLTNQTVELKGTGEVGDTILLYVDGNATTVVATGSVGASGTFDITTTATFGDGAHAFTAIETDSLSLTSAVSSPAAIRATSPSSSIASLLHPEAGRFTPGGAR